MSEQVTSPPTIEERRRLLEDLFFDAAHGYPDNLATICLDFRASLNGSADPWSPQVTADTYKLLLMVRDTWQPSTSRIVAENQIDNAIWMLVMSTIALARQYMPELEQPCPAK